jgi:predicted O-methyltransferase YrrM
MGPTSPELLRRELDGVPFTDPDLGQVLYRFVCAAGVRSVLELGTGHGGSTSWLAAALAAGRGGRLTTIDRVARPEPAELLARIGLAGYVDIVHARRSYTWGLMRLIEGRVVEGRCQPLFDLCFVDGEHTWDTDGLAFFLVEKLLRPGGWMVFDDLEWTFATSPTLRDSELARSLPEDERTTPQVGRVFTLLVRQHPGFGEFRVRNGRGWARKAGRHGVGAHVVDQAHAAVREGAW